MSKGFKIVMKGAPPKFELIPMECKDCEHKWEHLVEREFRKYPCPECESLCTGRRIATATHHQHVSWSTWRV